jgi:hypothetical protein
LRPNKKTKSKRVAWHRGVQTGRKLPLNLKQIQSIRSHLKSAQKLRDLALFNLAIDSSLNAIDVVQLRVRDIAKGTGVLSQATVKPVG